MHFTTKQARELPPGIRLRTSVGFYSTGWIKPVQLTFSGNGRRHPLIESILGFRLKLTSPGLGEVGFASSVVRQGGFD